MPERDDVFKKIERGVEFFKNVILWTIGIIVAAVWGYFQLQSDTAQNKEDIKKVRQDVDKVQNDVHDIELDVARLKER